MTERIFLYAFGTDHKCVAYRFIPREAFGIRELFLAADMIFDRPGVARVYALDDFGGLYYEYRKAVKDMSDFAEHIAFESLIADRGLLIRER